MKTYYFKKGDKGIIGDAFEMTIKDALRRENADTVSPAGRPDFRYKHKNYDAKQNGSVLKYAEYKTYVRGSNRVVYATHVAHTIVETDDCIGVTIDLFGTDMYVVDKHEFINYLQQINAVKYNSARHQVNVQSLYNYTKNAYHGKKGKMLEDWMEENQLDDDDIIEAILDGAW